MIKRLRSVKPFEDFIESFKDDPNFSNPHVMYDLDTVYEAHKAVDNLILAVFRDNDIIGLFVFLVLIEDEYIEMLVGLSREVQAYDEILAVMREKFTGYHVDFVINPNNHLIKSVLEKEGAKETEVELFLKSTNRVELEKNPNIIPYSSKYVDQYKRIHEKYIYWSAERVLNAQNIFRTLIAVENGKVVGYIDFIYTCEENEIYSLNVSDEASMDYTRDLIAAAVLSLNGSTMIVTAAPDEVPMYESIGFVVQREMDRLTVSIDL